ncbi:MAG: hypothetical protein WBM50_13385 [Acidimicrobiales bacterium]
MKGITQTGLGEPRKVPRHHPAQAMTLAEYVRHQNGVPLGASGALRNMLSRSLGAGSFTEFWRHWNPIWGYSLGRFVSAPLRRVLPPAPAVITTFAVSGALHDLAATLIRRSATFVITPWFLLLGVGVVFGRFSAMDLSQRPGWVRVTANLAYLGACLVPVLLI